MFGDVITKVVLVLTYALLVATVALMVIVVALGVDSSSTHGCTTMMIGKVVSLICY